METAGVQNDVFDERFHVQAAGAAGFDLDGEGLAGERVVAERLTPGEGVVGKGGGSRERCIERGPRPDGLADLGVIRTVQVVEGDVGAAGRGGRWILRAVAGVSRVPVAAAADSSMDGIRTQGPCRGSRTRPR